MFQSDEEGVDVIDAIAFIFIVLLNVKFLLFWTYLIMLRFPKYPSVSKIAKILGRILMVKPQDSSKNINEIFKKNEEKLKDFDKNSKLNNLIIFRE